MLDIDVFLYVAENALLVQKWFPRIFLPEMSQGLVFDLVDLQDCICPAPIMPDLSLIHIAEIDQVRAEGVRGRARRVRLDQNPAYNAPLIPLDWLCSREFCTSLSCTLLHPEQCPGADPAKTHIFVINKLILAMSRGVWD